VNHADLVVDLDLAVRRDGSVARTRSRHVLQGRTVRVITTDEGGLRVRMLDVRAWRSELAQACRVRAPCPAVSAPDPGLELPWDLVVGTGRALRDRRADVYAELMARARPSVRDELALVHRGTTGRLRAVGAMPGRRRIGWVSWVLLADGWQALTPYVTDEPTGRRAMVRLEGRRPEDLAREVARWMSGAGR
jgi:hypothetical protein